MSLPERNALFLSAVGDQRAVCSFHMLRHLPQKTTHSPSSLDQQSIVIFL